MRAPLVCMDWQENLTGLERAFSAKEICEGGEIPEGYGLGYRVRVRDSAVCFPLGLHLVARWARQAFYAFRFPRYLSQWERGYIRGWNDAKNHIARFGR